MNLLWLTVSTFAAAARARSVLFSAAVAGIYFFYTRHSVLSSIPSQIGHPPNPPEVSALVPPPTPWVYEKISLMFDDRRLEPVTKSPCLYSAYINP